MWISGSQHALWKHTQLVLDLVPGRGGGFSLEAPEGVRFLTCSRVFSHAELDELTAAPPLTGADVEAGAVPATQPGSTVISADRLIESCPVPSVRR